MNFLFLLKCYQPLSEFFDDLYLCERNLSVLWQVSMCLQYLTQERGFLPVPTSLSPSDSFIFMNQMSHSYWFLFGNLFYITTKRQWRRHDNPKQVFFLSWSQHQPPTGIRRVCLVDTCPGRKWHSVVFSNSIRGIHNGGFSPRFTTSIRIQHENPGVWRSLVNMLDFFTTMNCFSGKEQITE